MFIFRPFVFLCLFLSAQSFLQAEMGQDARKIALCADQLSPQLMQKLIELFGVEILVETGTWGGDSAKRAASFFRQVHTVELDSELFRRASERLSGYANVYCYEDSSPRFLRKIVPQIEGRILFWLDAHWCGENTAKEGLNTPIRNELRAIQESGVKNGVILIDDIRCFHALDPDYPEYGGYPLLSEVKKALLEINEGYQFWVLGDMAIAFPAEDGVEPTDLVKGCTFSRLFEEDDQHLAQEILDAELLIRNAYTTSEALEIQKLQRAVIPSTECLTYHLVLWKGLLHLGKGGFESAAHCFSKVLEAGYRHERVYRYLAEAQRGNSG